jgi:hypothetical protein
MAVHVEAEPEAGSKAAQLQQAVALLGAETDEKRFVGLLLVTKVAVAPAELRMVFESGYAFVRRLLSSPPPPEDLQAGATGNAYRTLALSVLASFCTDPELSARVELLECLSAAAAALSDTACVASPAEARDAQTVLCTVLQQPGGLAEAAGARICSRLLAPAATRSAALGPPLAGEQEEEEGPGCACAVLALVGDLALAFASDAAAASDGGRAVGRALSAELLHAAASLRWLGLGLGLGLANPHPHPHPHPHPNPHPNPKQRRSAGVPGPARVPSAGGAHCRARRRSGHRRLPPCEVGGGG